MELRANLPTLPKRMKRLPLDHRGFPVPWFVAWFEGGKPCEPGHGAPDFRVIDTPKIGMAVNQRRCCVCGDKLDVHMAFVTAPMGAIQAIAPLPPSHRDCAVFSATACPFLSQPRMRRNEKDLPEGDSPFGLKRNPEAVCVWITRSYRPFRAHAGTPGILFRLGAPEETLWFANGRVATREEVMESITSGLPTLMELAEKDGPEGVMALQAQKNAAMALLPARADDE